MNKDTDGKLIIDYTDIYRIKAFAHIKFKEYGGFGPLDNQEIQTLLIVEALHDFLKSQGIDPLFKVRVK